MESNRNVQLYKKIIGLLSVSVLLITFFITMYQSTLINPDGDAYWLVANGRYIVEYQEFPKINPWVSEGEFAIVIQQPICSILNYLWSSFFGGLASLWQLATVMNAIMIISMLHLTKKLGYSRPASFLGIAVAEIYIMIAPINTTRPYQFTIAMSCILLANLEVARKDKSYKRAAITVALLTLWQANYQMASLIAIPLFVSCYTVGALCTKIVIYVSERNPKIFSIKDFLKAISLYIIWAICTVVNPYGIDGALYLFRSSGVVTQCKKIIVELQPFTINSKQALGIMFVMVLYVLIYGRTFYKCFERLFLVGGCLVAGIIISRNFWMVIVATFFVVPSMIENLFDYLQQHIETRNVANAKESEKHDIPENVSLKQKEQKRIFIYLYVATFVISVACIILSINSSSLLVNNTNKFVAEIQKIPENANIYTNFDTGGLVEYAGRKIYIDARPELFSPAFTGGEDRLSEWINLYYGDFFTTCEIMQKHTFDYYIVQPFDAVENYLTSTGTGELIYADYSHGWCIYKRIESN